MKGDDVARLPVDDGGKGGGKDEYCSVCSDDTVMVVIECKHKSINLCSWCLGVMKANMVELKVWEI